MADGSDAVRHQGKGLRDAMVQTMVKAIDREADRQMRIEHARTVGLVCVQSGRTMKRAPDYMRGPKGIRDIYSGPEGAA